jgi:hypothetical protein
VLAARLVEEAVAGDGIVYVFGSGHSQLAALELNRRAGGLAPLQVILDPTWGVAERIEGFGAALVAALGFGPPDCLVVISSSGSTRASIEIARTGRAAASGHRGDVDGRVSTGRLGPRPSPGWVISRTSSWTTRDGARPRGPRRAWTSASPDVDGRCSGPPPRGRRERDRRTRPSGLDPPVLGERGAAGREYNAKLIGRYRGRLQRVRRAVRAHRIGRSAGLRGRNDQRCSG